MRQTLHADQAILDYLKQKDPVLGALIDRTGPLSVTLSDDYFGSLASAIVGQQLSNRVAEVLWDRLSGFCEGNVTPEKLAAAETEDLRALGLSYGKVSYLKALAGHVLEGSLELPRFAGLDDEEIIRQLTAVKGIGPWTAEMFLIFSLGREDVYSMGDGGLLRAVQTLYGLEGKGGKGDKAALAEITGRWAPYRTFASLYLWRALDG
jgi:DNA-3-methyladenine glycosylase II